MHDSQPTISSGDIPPCAGSDLPVQPWKATPILWLSAIFHAGSVLLLLLQPALWKWSLGMVALNQLIISLGVLHPRSRLLGPNMTRLPEAAAHRGEVAITFDDGPDPDITPKILDMLDRYGAKASFFCIADKVAAYPELAREIIARGHSIENHTQRHPHAFALFGPIRLQREINAAQTTICTATGVAPKFFRAPMGFRTPFLAPEVERAGLRYVTWTRRGYDVFATHPEPVLQRLKHRLAPGDILLLHDGRSSPALGNSSLALKVLPGLLSHLQERGLRSVTLPGALP